MNGIYEDFDKSLLREKKEQILKSDNLIIDNNGNLLIG